MAERLSEEELAARLAEVFSRADEVVSFVARSRPGDDERKLVGRSWGEPGARKVTITRFASGRQTGQETLAATELGARAPELARAPHAHWEVATTAFELHARRAKRAILLTQGKPSAARAVAKTHDRKKDLLLDPRAPEVARVLAAIGLATRAGHVLPGRERKLRQVERFVRLVLDAAGALRGRARLEILDAGCGAAYLTFALQHVLARELGIPVALHGVDVRADVIEEARRTAAELGLDATSVRFTQARIDAAPTGNPDVVLSLHACDTATDEALAAGVRAGATLVLAAPCCQHELHKQLAADALGPLLRHGILRERLADLATDALRAHVLRARGYRTDVVEFVEAEATAKNLLIRAVRADAKPEPRWAEELAQFKRALGVAGAVTLERLLPTSI